LCTLEFENNRDLYDWVLEHTRAAERHGFSRPQQIEFARLNLDHTVLSKRKLQQLVEGGYVSGWDDPRMPTIAGMRRRGYRPEAIRAFADLIGVAKVNSVVDMGKLEYCVRDDLNRVAPRALGVLHPLKVTITSWPEGEVEELPAPYFPPDVGTPGERALPFSRELFIDRDDFALDPPRGYLRLAPGRTVRLRHGYCITCDEVVERDGEVVGLRCRHIPGTAGASPPDVTVGASPREVRVGASPPDVTVGASPPDVTVGASPPEVKVWGVIQWVSAAHALTADVRLYDRLFRVARPDFAEGDLADYLNPDSLQVVTGARLEPSLAAAEPGSRWQLERVGYFVVDAADSRPGAPVLNRIVGLRDSWADAASESEREPAADIEAEGRPTSAKSRTRPPKRSRAEYRAEARARDEVLAERYARWPAQHGIGEAEADLLSGDRATGDLFESAVAAGAPAAAVARWMVNELARELGDRPVTAAPVTGETLAALINAVERGEITGVAAKDVFAEMMQRGGDPRRIIDERGLAQVSDEAAIAGVVDEVIAANADKVGQYRDGKKALFGFFVGQVMKASQGKANPQVVQKALAERLG
jgi:glutaminyl-tRNA synthetase